MMMTDCNNNNDDNQDEDNSVHDNIADNNDLDYGYINACMYITNDTRICYKKWNRCS